MQNDSELDSILQEAREGYQRRIEDLKHSLKSISNQENLKSPNLSPFKNTSSESLHYSTTFRPISIESNPFYSPCENSSKKAKPLSSNHSFSSNLDPQDEARALKDQLKDLKSLQDRTSQKYEESEKINIELRLKIKDLTISLSKLTEENSVLKEKKNEPSSADLQNVKIHYKKKIGIMREELVKRDSEIAKHRKEIENQARLQTSIRQVCETQVKEISEEYAKNLKKAGKNHFEELQKLKVSFENMSEAQFQEFISQANNLKSAIVEYERSNKVYQDRLEKIMVSKEESDRGLREKTQEVQEMQGLVQDLQRELGKSASSAAQLENALKDSQSMLKKLQTEYEKTAASKDKQEKLYQEREKVFENKLQQNTEDIWKKQQVINKLQEEIERQEKLLVRIKHEAEAKIEEEQSKNHSIQAKYQEFSSDMNDLSFTLDNLRQRNSFLEDQINTQSLENKKKSEIEISKYNEKIKKLEHELRSLYLANSTQAEEMDSLKALCSEIETKQEQEIRSLLQRNEEKLKEIKKQDRSEYLHLCDALEATKLSLHNAETTIEKYELALKDLQNKEKSNLVSLKNIENYKKQTDEAISQYRVLSQKYLKLQASSKKQRDSFFSKFRKLKESYKVCLKETVEQFQGFKIAQEKCLSVLLKTFFSNFESLKKNFSSKFHSESQSIKSMLDKKEQQIAHLKLELESQSQKHFIGEQSLEKLKSDYSSTLGALVSSVSYLENYINESYKELETAVLYLKDFISQDSEDLKVEQRDIIEQAKRSVEFYRDKLLKLENEKTAEFNRSQNELASLQYRLSQVLEDIRDSKF